MLGLSMKQPKSKPLDKKNEPNKLGQSMKAPTTTTKKTATAPQPAAQKSVSLKSEKKRREESEAQEKMFRVVQEAF